uniref:Uncharacterized protein n=1 Tax=Arundo donax TaxID=35708 RepID=A0A0A9SSG1_ARUDO
MVLSVKELLDCPYFSVLICDHVGLYPYTMCVLVRAF